MNIFCSAGSIPFGRRWRQIIGMKRNCLLTVFFARGFGGFGKRFFAHLVNFEIVALSRTMFWNRQAESWHSLIHSCFDVRFSYAVVSNEFKKHFHFQRKICFPHGYWKTYFKLLNTGFRKTRSKIKTLFRRNITWYSCYGHGIKIFASPEQFEFESFSL